MTSNKHSRTNLGFTIVELLVVIVVIAILATITIVSYTEISKKANIASITSDLTNAKKQLSLYYTEYGTYPVALDNNNCPLTPTASTNYCLKLSNGNSFQGYYGNARNFMLSTVNNNNAVAITSDSSPTTLSLSQPADCPTGFIPVPGDPTYGTGGFCVMKYEAKIQGNDNGTQTYNSTYVPESRASGTPWVNISQASAIAEAETACTGCHLISEAEWMTLAKNALSVPENWSGGAVGSGYIYSGHNDNAPASSLMASTDDSDGYYGTGNTAGSNQKRTLKLTNGEVIWDMAGNVRDWTSGKTTGNQPGATNGGFDWREYTALTNPGSLTVDMSPVGTGISGSSSWTSVHGIGRIHSDADDIILRSIYRGGGWNNSVNAGILSSVLSYTPNSIVTGLGFRVSR